MESPVLEFLLNNVAGLGLQLFKTATPTQVFSCEYCEIIKNNCFKEYLRTAASAPPYPLFNPLISSVH